MQQVDGLERPHHDLEAGDLPRRVPPDHVDAVDPDAVDLGGELQHGRTFRVPAAQVVEAVVVERREGEKDKKAAAAGKETKE